MSENRCLLIGIGSIFGFAILLVVAVTAEEKLGIIDHFVHVGADEHVFKKELELADRREQDEFEQRIAERLYEQRSEEWTKEVTDLWSSQNQ